MPASLPPGSPPSISAQDFVRFRDIFYRKTGIMFADNKRYFVDKRLQQRMSSGGYATFCEYFDKVCFQASGEELQHLVNAMTVNETYFYREDYQLKCLVQSLLPEITRGKANGAPVKIWSLPCSTGEEAYSITFHLLEYWNRVDDFNIEIIASDIDTEVLRRARQGIYSERSLQYVPKATLAKYADEIGGGQYQIRDEIRNSISFTQVNIMDVGRSRLYADIDVVFCRNLLIYFDDLSRREAAETIYAALNPGGFVCLGHSESMSRISSLFEMRKFTEAMVYQKPIAIKDRSR